jgi:hypothetical protein
LVRGATSISQNRWTYTTRVIPTIGVDRAKWRNTLTYRIDNNLQVGVEYNPLGDDVGPLVNWRILTETKNRPAVILGTSSDRIGTPTGRAYYMTVSKEVADDLGVYVGVMYGEFEQNFTIPAGVSYRFDDKWSALFAFDGVNGHPMVTYQWDRCNLTFIMVGSKHPGLSFGVGF